MKHLLFSLAFLCLGFTTAHATVAPPPQTAEEQQRTLEEYLRNGGLNQTAPLTRTDIESFFNKAKANTAQYLSEEDEFYLTLKPGQTVENYITSIKAENARRMATGQGLLPDPTTSTTQVPPNNGVIRPSLDGPAPVINGTMLPVTPTSNTTVKAPGSIPFLDQLIPPGAFSDGLGGNPLNKIFNQLFYLGLIIAVASAIFMIIRGGIEYMTIDAMASKESGKKRVQAALGGLLLAFSAVLILNTISPGLTKLNVVFPALKSVQGTTLFGGLTNGVRYDPTTGQMIPTGNFGAWNEGGAESWVKGLQDGTRGTDGRLNVSVYSATGDAITDSNTAERRGNANNLLREGSVALSPDLISQYNPKTGSEVFINGISVGFYEDATASSYNGTTFKNTIDIYDQNKTLNWSGIKNVPSNQWKITFGNPRPQIKND